jgi:hypothetical protein
MRVSLITTGMMEFRGLACGLKRMFPDHDFYSEPWVPGKPFRGFTASRVQPLQPGHQSGLQAERLVRAALGTVMPSSASEPAADFAVVLEDLELANTGNEPIVVNHVRAAAQMVAQGLRPPANQTTVRGLLRNRVSFHLAVPMPESWFFGDFKALATEVPQAHMPPVVAHTDPEMFNTYDPAYLADTGAGCTRWIGAGSKPSRRPPWLIARRAEHPKAYLQWLCRDPGAGDCMRYKETQEGRRLLACKLTWSTVLRDPATFTYLRSLVRDLEAALGTAARGVPAGGAVAPLTSVTHARTNPVLRNI